MAERSNEEDESIDRGPAPEQGQKPPGVRLISVYDNVPEDYDTTCLRPLGLCELGDSCDVCWYNPHRPGSLGQRPTD